jgi:cytosine/uracil/thiamine/allantoin permease
MKIDVFIPMIDLVLKGILYYTALKLRKLDARLITCALCAGAYMLAGYIPLPSSALHFLLTIVIAGFFIVKNSDADVYPDGIGIPFAVEVVDAFALRFAVMPLIEML